MTSARYVGYLGGAAVAAGVGVAMAVGGQATAHAEAEGTQASVDSKGPEKPSPVAKLEKRLAKAEKRVESAVRNVKFDPSDAVKALKKQFATNAPARDHLTAVKADSKLASKAAAAAETLAASPKAKAAPTADTSSDALFTNPFRADDPDPTPAGMFGSALAARNVALAVSPDLIDPFVREGFEAGYRVSQMVPWVNLPIPLAKSAGSAGGDQRVTQVTINQLLLTLPPIGILYYGYDQVADLLNVEGGAANFKDDFYTVVWDTLDFADLLHNRGQSGLPQ